MSEAPFIQAMCKATQDAWLKGWDERNGGNISLLVDDEALAPYLNQLSGKRQLALPEAMPELANRYVLVTGSGKYFRNVTLEPEVNLGLLRISDDGSHYQILWGLEGDSVPTSEISAHFLSHVSRLKASGGKNRVIMHCHATNLIALTYVVEPDSAVMTRTLWEGSTECLVVFPEGVALLPWLVPGTDAIGQATAEMMLNHQLVLWPFHGVFGSGQTLDEAFGLIDTAEKSAEVMVKVRSMGGARQSISREQFIALAERFGVTANPQALY
ncbi:L-rhamnulose 1-phosphate aldolase [Celerinatantimonas diazotrophica]|uniref:Rhamnulose-1-phosphate aldolase n=2 Tax=Celerinatantimonas diazotrophica TaxID=412034 RepID=A0A4R1JME6_9GAMM|nr:L-rhamnulose 1-phosphate aldolase [Celerinatantimonas diazotrophica]CAG9296098.1 Rhamnulose-1-phosphate aldolase [Celerinatantimonas diazotrophica]